MADAMPRTLFLGMTGAFSQPPLEALLSAGLPVCAVVVPGEDTDGPPVSPLRLPRRSGGLPVLTPYVKRNIVHLAWDAGIPVYQARRLGSPEFNELVCALGADALVVACFNRLIPRGLRERVSLAVNVHPSLLPAGRGPAPLFWTFRLGWKRAGVTVHRLEGRMDAGAIAAQEGLVVPDGIAGDELERQLAEIGGGLLAGVLRRHAAGTLDFRDQDEMLASAQPWPAPADWTVPLDWPAGRAFNFIRGVAHLGGPLMIAGRRIRDARAWDEDASLGRPVNVLESGLLEVQMRRGVLTVVPA